MRVELVIDPAVARTLRAQAADDSVSVEALCQRFVLEGLRLFFPSGTPFMSRKLSHWGNKHGRPICGTKGRPGPIVTRREQVQCRRCRAKLEGVKVRRGAYRRSYTVGCWGDEKR